LSEEICREFRLGLSPTAPALARKAAEKGFTRTELAAAGLANRRGNDYFSGRLMFPLADARGRVVGYSARKLREDDPLQAKYVNSPEGDLFHKSSVLYGLHLARHAIAKEERAIVVEGNTDAIALRQAGLEPVVASMGTALTERQLAELKRLTRRLYLCFDADAAGQAATLRGMELAASLGFEVKVVPLEPGLDPADAADSFGELLGRAESYVFYRVRIELDRAADRQEAFVRVREVLSSFEDSPERQDAMRLVADRLDLPPETQAGLAPRGAAASRQGRGWSATRWPVVWRIRRWCRFSRSCLPTISTASRTAVFRLTLPSRASRPPSSYRCLQSWTPAPPARRSTSRRPRSSCLGSVSVTSAGSWPRIPRGPTSSMPWNASMRPSVALSRWQKTRLSLPVASSARG
jgi:DNA primase